MKYIDLHIHTKHSDGKCTISQILDMAVENNVSVISLTEHYNLSSLYPARRMIRENKKYSGIEIVPGIEIGAKLDSFGMSKKHVCHILAYYVSNRIYSVLKEYEQDRKSTNERIINRLRLNHVDISYERISRFYKNKSFGRYDIAKYLAEKGEVRTIEEAYSKYLDYGQMAHIERNKMPPDILIKELIRCGGVPVIAHPKSLRLSYTELDQFVSYLAKCGLAGIEVYNPRMKKEEIEIYNQICQKYNLISTVGSDFHRVGQDIKIGLGIENNLCISDYTIIERLKERKHKIDLKKF